jgi:hypothetical protein
MVVKYNIDLNLDYLVNLKPSQFPGIELASIKIGLAQYEGIVIRMYT